MAEVLIFMLFGNPTPNSRPLISYSNSGSSWLIVFTFNSSAVLSPINKLYSSFTNSIISSFKWSPAILTDLDNAAPPDTINAISVVPPPISTIKCPFGSNKSIPTPIAAAIGSSIR